MKTSVKCNGFLYNQFTILALTLHTIPYFIQTRNQKGKQKGKQVLPYLIMFTLR